MQKRTIGNTFNMYFLVIKKNTNWVKNYLNKNSYFKKKYQVTKTRFHELNYFSNLNKIFFARNEI